MSWLFSIRVNCLIEQHISTHMDERLQPLDCSHTTCTNAAEIPKPIPPGPALMDERGAVACPAECCRARQARALNP
jgi:hypothetical protein